MCRKFVGLVVVAGIMVGSPLPVFSTESVESVGLRKAIELALLHNRELAKARLSVRSGQIALARAQSEFASELTPSGSLGADSGSEIANMGLQWSKKLALGTSLRAGASVTAGEAKLDEGNEWYYQSSASLSIEQPLFENFGILVNKEPLNQAVESLRAHARMLHMQKADVIVAVVEAYLDVLRLEMQTKTDVQFLARMEKLQKLTRAKEKQGKATRVDSLRIDLQHGRAQIRLENDRELCSSRRRDLSEQIGLTTDSAVNLEPVPFIESALPDNEIAVRIALSNRLDYAQALDDTRSAERTTRIARKRLAPNISLITRYSLTSDYEDALTFGSSDGHRWFFGLTSSGDLLGTSKQLDLEESLINSEARQADVEIIASEITRQVQHELAGCRRSFAEVTIAERNVELADARAKLARRLFESGRGDNFAVSDAEDEAFSAYTVLLTAKANVVISVYRLRRALGTLIDSAEELKPTQVGGFE